MKVNFRSALVFIAVLKLFSGQAFAAHCEKAAEFKPHTYDEDSERYTFSVATDCRIENGHISISELIEKFENRIVNGHKVLGRDEPVDFEGMTGSLIKVKEKEETKNGDLKITWETRLVASADKMLMDSKSLKIKASSHAKVTKHIHYSVRVMNEDNRTFKVRIEKIVEAKPLWYMPKSTFLKSAAPGIMEDVDTRAEEIVKYFN